MDREERLKQLKERIKEMNFSSQGSQILGKDNLIRIGKFVKTKRIGRGYTVMSFRYKCWTTMDIIRKIENGENVDMKSLFHVLHHLGYTLSIKKSGTGYDVKIREWSYFG